MSGRRRSLSRRRSESKGTDAAPEHTADWKSRSEETKQQRLKLHIKAAQKTGRLDLTDPKPGHANMFRFHLEMIPKQVSKTFAASDLRELWLTNNSFAAVPEFVTQLPKLTTLCMSGNQLVALNAPLFKCTQLENLYLSRNEIVALPPEFAELGSLRELSIDHNHLARFSPAICKARFLRRLDLSHNKITSVPAQIRRLTNLIAVNLDDNQIGPTVPPELMRLSGLVAVGLANNCLETAPNLAKRPQGSVPVSLLRVSGNRSAKFKVYHDSGVVLEGENIPKRKDGYLQLRKGFLVTEPDGSTHKRVEDLEGYLKEGYRFNVSSANWYQSSEEMKVLKARAKTRRIRAAVTRVEAAAPK